MTSEVSSEPDDRMIRSVRLRVVGSWLGVVVMGWVGLKLTQLLRSSMGDFGEFAGQVIAGGLMGAGMSIRFFPVVVPMLGPPSSSKWGPPFLRAFVLSVLTLLVALWIVPLRHVMTLWIIFGVFFLSWAVIWELCVLWSPRRFVDFTPPPPRPPLPPRPPKEPAPKCGQCGIDLRPGRTGCHWCGWKPGHPVESGSTVHVS
jgi:hypothetical protein